MSIWVNEGGTHYELSEVWVNEGGTYYELNEVWSNENGNHYQIHSSWAMPTLPTWNYSDIYTPSSSGPPSKDGTSSGNFKVSENTWKMYNFRGMAVANFTLKAKTKITVTITDYINGSHQWRNEVQIDSGHTTSPNYNLKGGAYYDKFATSTTSYGTSYTASSLLTKEYTLDKGDYHLVCACGLASANGAGSSSNSLTTITNISAIVSGGMDFNVVFEKA